MFIAALEKDLDVYCEKPLAYDIDDGKAMVQAAGGIYYFKDKITMPDVLTVHFDFDTCPVVWDPASEQIVGNPEAAKLLRREYRTPWKHPYRG